MTTGVDRVDTVAGIAMNIAPANPSSEVEGDWAGRVETLANWLLAQWHRERDQLAEGINRHCDLN